MWQEEQFPLPKKNAAPAATSPATALSIAGAERARTNATNSCNSRAESWNAGMPPAGIPLRISSLKSSADRLRALSEETMSGPRSPPYHPRRDMRRNAPRNDASLHISSLASLDRPLENAALPPHATSSQTRSGTGQRPAGKAV